MAFPVNGIFLPFSATAVVNFDLGGTIQGYGLQPYQLMTVLFLLREGPKLLAGRNDLKISHPLGLSLALLFIFVGIVVLSLIMPFIINGRISIMDYSLKQYVPHIFTAHHVTQTLLVIFGAVITAVTASFNNTTDRILLTFRAYVLSGVFVGLWGFLQLIFYHLNIPYPDFIFNNSMSEAARNFGGVLEDVGMKRVSSVAVEPSIFAQFLLTVIPFILYAIITRKKIISHAIDKLILILLSTILLLSTSTAGSVGFIVMCFLFYY